MSNTQQPTQTTTQTVVVSVRVDGGVLAEIARLMKFRFRTPIGRETYLRMILYGDEPPINPAVRRDSLSRVDFRLPEPSVNELAVRVDGGNRSEHIRGIITGRNPSLSPLPSHPEA